jgi:rhodanese-related sulfurtransferase
MRCTVKETVDASRLDRGVLRAKQTAPGFYLTAQQGFEKWKANPIQVKIRDVRTVEEYLLLGHREMAWNVALALQTYYWDKSGSNLSTQPNPEFLTPVKRTFNLSGTLIVMCRSGGRSAKVVDLLAAAGFNNVYNIIDGMEGDVVDEAESVYRGKRLRNGWKNSGLPWTYHSDPKKMRLPATAAERDSRS